MAASVIGKQTALLRAREGAAVLVTDIDDGGAETTAQAIAIEGGRSLLFGHRGKAENRKR